MWLMTPRGFFSAVQKHEDGTIRVTVRARVKQDLLNLSDLLPDAKPYQEKFFTDYPWRINVTKEEWAKACAVMALEIDYGNFKDEVKVKQGAARAAAYGRVWSVLLSLERRARTWGSDWSGGFHQDELDLDRLYDTSPRLSETATQRKQRLDDEAISYRKRMASGDGEVDRYGDLRPGDTYTYPNSPNATYVVIEKVGTNVLVSHDGNEPFAVPAQRFFPVFGEVTRAPTASVSTKTKRAKKSTAKGQTKAPRKRAGGTQKGGRR
jgi:hypothetical protein